MQTWGLSPRPGCIGEGDNEVMERDYSFFRIDGEDGKIRGGTLNLVAGK